MQKKKSLSKEIEVIQKNQLKITELKNTITFKNSLCGVNSRVMTEDRVRELEDKQNLYREKGSKKKICEQSLLDLWYNNKCFKFIEVPELREGRAERVFRETMDKMSQI